MAPFKNTVFWFVFVPLVACVCSVALFLLFFYHGSVDFLLLFLCFFGCVFVGILLSVLVCNTCLLCLSE